MKKFTLFLCFTFLFMTVLLFHHPVYAMERMEINKTVCSPSAPLEIHCYGVTAEEAAREAWIAIGVPGAPANSYLNWNYLYAGDNHLILMVPDTPGTYEVRFYQANSASEENLVRERSLQFTVSYGPSISSMTLDHTSYLPGQHLEVTYSGVSDSAVQHEAWIAVARAGGPAANYLDWKYVNPGNGSLWLDVPSEPGNYEVRFYPAGRATEENLRDGLRIPFTVTDNFPSDDRVLYPSKNDFDWDLLEYVPGNRSWTGTYETNYKTLSLIQDGNTISGNYPDWDNGRLEGIVEKGMLWGYWFEEPTYSPPNDAGQIVFALYPDGQGFRGWWRYGNNGKWETWSSGTLNLQAASLWAKEEVYSADARHLIPACLQGADLTKEITYAEFSALAVHIFEELWQTQEIPIYTSYASVQGHPLQSEIEKAYGLGFLKPVQPDLLKPDVGFSREIMAAMFCNLIKACEFDGCTLENVDSFFLPYVVRGHLIDESTITSAYRDSVCFLTSFNLMDTMSGNRFDPQGRATREQAIVTALRIFLRESAVIQGQILPASQALSN